MEGGQRRAEDSRLEELLVQGPCDEKGHIGESERGPEWLNP